MKKTINDLIINLKSPIPIICWLCGSLVCAAIGPFGTYETDPIGFRMVFWFSILFIATVYGLLCYHAVWNFRPNWPILKVISLSGSYFIFTYTLFISILIRIIYEPPVPSVLFIAIIVACVTSAIAFLMYVFHTSQIDNKNPTPALRINLKHRNQNEFLSRIDTDMGTRLIRLTMRDHYVETYTCNGMQLIHMRFSDAVSALSEFNGFQIHRSHWANLDEVTGTIKKENKVFFIMSDGFEAPIARGKVNQLKDLGLLS